MKDWAEGQAEPSTWAVESLQGTDDLPSGSLLFVAHNSDVTLHRLTVTTTRPE